MPKLFYCNIKFKIIAIVILIATSLSFAIRPINTIIRLHPYFISVLEIEQNAKGKSIEISCKIFTDDFEKTLRKNNSTVIDLINPKNKNTINTIINEYLQKHIALVIDGKKCKMQFVGYEQQEENIVCYFEIENIITIKKVEVVDSILYDYKNEQMGIVHVTVNDERKSGKLNNPNYILSFMF